MGNMSLPKELRTGAFQRFPGIQKRAGSRIRLLGGIAAALLVTGAAWWLSGQQTGAPSQEPAPPVIVARAVLKPVTMFERTIGTVVANATVQVTSRVEGQLVSAAFKEGDFVKKEDLLFQLDPRPFKAALDQALATQKKDEAQAAAARHDAERYAALVAQGAVSRSEADQILANAHALAATVAADKANVEAARLNLAYTQIRSPIDGKTGAIAVEPGNIVPANGTIPLVTITQIEPIKVSFSLPQGDLPIIQSQMKAGKLMAVIEIRGAQDRQLQAPVTFVGNEVSGRTGTIELRATFPNKDHALVPGQLVDVKVALKNLPKAIVVPHRAVNAGPDGPYVYVVENDKIVSTRPVKVLYDDGTQAAVSGRINSGDRVVTEGQLRLLPGMAVSIIRPGA